MKASGVVVDAIEKKKRRCARPSASLFALYALELSVLTIHFLGRRWGTYQQTSQGVLEDDDALSLRLRGERCFHKQIVRILI